MTFLAIWSVAVGPLLDFGTGMAVRSHCFGVETALLRKASLEMAVWGPSGASRPFRRSDSFLCTPRPAPQGEDRGGQRWSVLEEGLGERVVDGTL